jgi:DNA modification methylase
MSKIQILTGDSFELIKDLPDNSVDLVLTSPPYADIISYGKDISVKKPTEYVEWILPLFKEILRVLKPTGSFILNINDTCKNGVRNPFIYELVYRTTKDTKLKLYDTYIWHKMNGIPNGGSRRFRNTTEFLFHFVKDQRQTKFYMNRVLKDPAQATQDRSKYQWTVVGHREISDGKRGEGKSIDYGTKVNKVRPDNVFRFHTAGLARDNTIRHPAPFHKSLPEYFINLLTDEGDLVLDVFSGIGTTGIPCKELNRDFIGYELNGEYAEFSKGRLEGIIPPHYEVCQYDLEGNLIGRYKNRQEASEKTGVCETDIMRTYNRTKFQTRGGYKWVLEPKQ